MENKEETSKVAFYLYAPSEEWNQKSSLADQVEACQRFLENQGWVFSGDIFVERKDSPYIERLATARAWSQRFDKMLSYVVSDKRASDEKTVGIIACFDALKFTCNKKFI